MNSMPTAENRSRGVYQAHRDRQRRRILDAAEKLFDDRGIDRVTMADITSAAGLRASTTYEYFSNKDEIVWAMVEQFMVESAGSAEEAIGRVRGPALDRIAALLDWMGQELVSNPQRVRFLAQFDALYARDWTPERLLAIEKRITPAGFAGMAALIQEGIADGSLRPDLDPNLTMHSVLNAAIGAQRRLASLGYRVEMEYGQPVERLFRETTRLILLGLREPAGPASLI